MCQLEPVPRATNRTLLFASSYLPAFSVYPIHNVAPRWRCLRFFNCVCVCLLQVEQVKLLDRFSNKFTNGTLYLTATHLIFVESSSNNSTSAAQEIWVSSVGGDRFLPVAHPVDVASTHKALWVDAARLIVLGVVPQTSAGLQGELEDDDSGTTFSWLRLHVSQVYLLTVPTYQMWDGTIITVG